jgi:xeroderma pigmentosum group C-complementing protein
VQTSFEFRKGKAFPVISGIVVAAENEDTILEASWEAEHAAAEKEQEKRQQAVLKRWTKLVQGLRIRQRMREEYGAGAQGDGTLGLRSVGSNLGATRGDDAEGDEDGTQLATAGGFLTGVEDVVQPYSLPRPTHAVFSSPPRSPGPSGRASPAPVGPASPESSFVDVARYDDDDADDADVVEEPRLLTEDLDVDTDDAGASSCQHPRRRMPKSMAALAAEVAQAQALANEEDSASGSGSASASASVSATVPVPTNRTVARRAASKSKSTPKTRAKKPNAKAVTGRGTGTTKARGRRKRCRGRDHEADASGSGSDLDDTASDDERDVDMEMDVDEDEDMDGARSRVAKRAGKQRQGRSNLRDADAGADSAVQVPQSDRVLRARKGKSGEELARERERELAVKRALAG